MTDRYEPTSEFLIWVLNEEAPLTGSEQAAQNLARVIDHTRDENPINRDWATFILGNLDFETPATRSALFASAEDADARVRAEAIKGLARKDAKIALPYVQRALSAPSAMVNIFEAAAIIAHPSLVEALSQFTEPSGDSGFDELAADALRACAAGIPDTRYL